MRRRLGVLLALGLGVAGLAAGPAVADKPQEWEETTTFTDIDPCTGDEHEVTISTVFRLHEPGNPDTSGHPYSGLNHLSSTGATDSGYVMQNGGGTARQSPTGIFRFNGTDQWRHPDGRKVIVQSRIVLDLTTGKILVEVFESRCFGKPTNGT